MAILHTCIAYIPTMQYSRSSKHSITMGSITKKTDEASFVPFVYSLGDFLMDTLITRSRDSLFHSEDPIFGVSDGHINQPGAGILCSTQKMPSLDFLMDRLITRSRDSLFHSEYPIFGVSDGHINHLELGFFVPLTRCHLWIF